LQVFLFLFAAIGLAPYHYPLNAQPGWKANSVGYHADDGRWALVYFTEVGIGEELDSTCMCTYIVKLVTRNVVFVMSCGSDFRDTMSLFRPLWQWSWRLPGVINIKYLTFTNSFASLASFSNRPLFVFWNIGYSETHPNKQTKFFPDIDSWWFES